MTDMFAHSNWPCPDAHCSRVFQDHEKFVKHTWKEHKFMTCLLCGKGDGKGQPILCWPSTHKVAWKNHWAGVHQDQTHYDIPGTANPKSMSSSPSTFNSLNYLS